jgi:hypothetical protein
MICRRAYQGLHFRLKEKTNGQNRTTEISSLLRRRQMCEWTRSYLETDEDDEVSLSVYLLAVTTWKRLRVAGL